MGTAGEVEEQINNLLCDKAAANAKLGCHQLQHLGCASTHPAELIRTPEKGHYFFVAASHPAQLT